MSAASIRIEEISPDDVVRLDQIVDLLRETFAHDAPWYVPWEYQDYRVVAQRGNDGEAPTILVAYLDGELAAHADVYAFERDNHHLAWAEFNVHPRARRRGVGTAMLRHIEDLARARGRRVLATDGWDTPEAAGFAERHGYQQVAVEVARRQWLDQDATWRTLHEHALPHAEDYEFVQIPGATPPELLHRLAEAVAAINDAPRDNLDMEDSVFDADRVREFEEIQLARGARLYRLVARHRVTGELAGNSVVVVDGARPQVGTQHDTSVMARHRGHRLGLLLKTHMLDWLSQQEPALQFIDTWNSESNAHMIAVNEQLGYVVMGNGISYQRDLPGAPTDQHWAGSIPGIAP